MGTNQRQSEVIWIWAEFLYVQSSDILHFIYLFGTSLVIKTLSELAAQSKSNNDQKAFEWSRVKDPITAAD